MATRRKRKGVSLAKGPVALIGLASLVFGVLGLITGGQGFSVDVPSGKIEGENFLGVEGNGWTNVLFIGAGAFLLLGAQGHWGAKSSGLIVGLVFGAASVIAIVDGDDVFGIFAANGPTTLVWGLAATVLIVLGLLPRVGGRKRAAEPAPGAVEDTHDGERRIGRRKRERDPLATGTRRAEERERPH